MTIDNFLLLLMVVSVLTGLMTEGIKKVLDELEKAYRPNLLAGVVAVVLSVLVDSGYMILTETAMNAKMAVILIALLLLSWLCAMVGYDKVIQEITRLRGGTSEK